MKMRKVLAGILLAAMVLACVPAGPEGSTAVQAAQVTSTPDVTVTAPVIGQAPANAVLTTSGGLETTATVTTQNMTVDEEGGISGRITAANADNAVFNVTGTTKLLLHLQLKPEKTSQKQSIIGKMNAQYGLQIEGSTLLLFGKLSEGWYQVNYTIPNDAWYNEWHDVVAIYNGDKFELYVDGTVGTAASGYESRHGSLVASDDSIFTVGYNAGKEEGSLIDGQDYTGKIKDIHMYVGEQVPEYTIASGASAAEIRQIFADGLREKTSSFDMTGVTQEQTAYTLESTTWTPADAAFELYKDYKVEIVVKAAEGDTFASNAGATLRTGAAATLTEGVNVRTNGNRMTISYTFAGEEHPRVTLQNYLQSDAVTSVGMLEGGSRVNKDANGRRKYTAASWNVFAEKFNAAVAAAGHEGLAPEAYTKARTDLAAAIAGLKLAAQNCECTLTEITGFDGKELDLKGAESISVTLGAKYSYSKECEKHPGAEPSVSYELIGGPAGASLTGNVLTVTQTGDVQVRCTVRLGDVTKSAVASYPVVKNPVTELDLAKEEAQKALSSAETVYSAGQKDYPDAAWKAFETAYKAMKAVPENADAAALKKLADDLAKAQAALTKKTPGVVQDKEIIVTPLGRYQIVSAAKKTAKLVSVKNNKAKKLNVPASVKLNGVTCQVVEVGANVMKNNKSLTKVILGKNVAAVGKQAFFGCKNLKSVQLKGKALKKVGKSAFKKTSPKMVVSAKKMNKKDRAKLLKTMRKAGMSKKGRVK